LKSITVNEYQEYKVTLQEQINDLDSQVSSLNDQIDDCETEKTNIVQTTTQTITDLTG
jgi:prefoldin subunit 5